MINKYMSKDFFNGSLILYSQVLILKLENG